MPTTLPPDHAQRRALADEVHARPPEPLATPARISHLALMIDAGDRELEQQRLQSLCQAFGVAPPPPAGHWSLSLGALRLKWERHGEFSGFTFIAEDGVDGGFAGGALDRLPPGWLASLPGRTIMAAHALLLSGAGREADAEQLSGWFGPGATVVGSRVADGAGRAFTDFRLQPDGYLRVVLLDDGFTRRQAGRVLQRIFEIEVYRLLALLALPIAQTLAPRALQIESALAGLTAGIARDDGRDESLLQELTRLAAEVEQGLSQSQFRFGACRAYSQLVATRIAELREARLPGLQTVDEFMARRFSPALATCTSVSQRLHDLSERVSQASSLLATRVGIARERQNQALLASMDRRARQQLRLQQTVEGLSVAAIAYYAVGLVGYVAKALKAGGLPIDSDIAGGLAVPVLAGLAWAAVRRARAHAHDDADKI
ncbi:MAG: DUF3422 domain-containing protein [Rubrivivax sp.]